jgi:hypothetical protein
METEVQEIDGTIYSQVTVQGRILLLVSVRYKTSSQGINGGLNDRIDS